RDALQRQHVGGEAPSVVVQHILKRTAALALEHDRVPLVIAQLPQLRADERACPDDADVLADAPGDMGENILYRPFARDAGLLHAIARNARENIIQTPTPFADRAQQIGFRPPRLPGELVVTHGANYQRSES